MNETTRAALRESVLTAPEDCGLQLAWFRESLAEYQKIEQRLMAKFRLADFLGDVDMLEKIGKDVADARTAAAFLKTEIAKQEGN